METRGFTEAVHFGVGVLDRQILVSWNVPMRTRGATSSRLFLACCDMTWDPLGR